MGVNLVVWAWSDKFDTPAKRRKLKLKFDDIGAVWCDKGDHPCMKDFNFTKFEADVVAKIGAEKEDGVYLLERYPRSLCYEMSHSQASKLIPIIGGIAKKSGLNAAEF